MGGLRSDAAHEVTVVILVHVVRHGQWRYAATSGVTGIVLHTTDAVLEALDGGGRGESAHAHTGIDAHRRAVIVIEFGRVRTAYGRQATVEDTVWEGVVAEVLLVAVRVERIGRRMGQRRDGVVRGEGRRLATGVGGREGAHEVVRVVAGGMEGRELVVEGVRWIHRVNAQRVIGAEGGRGRRVRAIALACERTGGRVGEDVVRAVFNVDAV